jgi:hypothetical protein
MFDEFFSAIRETIGLMIDGGMLIDRCCCCLRSGISVVRIEAADGYSVLTLIAYEMQNAIDTFCRVISHWSSLRLIIPTFGSVTSSFPYLAPPLSPIPKSG